MGEPGTVETMSDAQKCADLFKKNAAKLDGILVTLPSFGDERGVAAVQQHGQRQRKVRMVPIGLKPVELKVEVPRYRCKQCGQTWEVSPPLSGRMST